MKKIISMLITVLVLATSISSTAFAATIDNDYYKGTLEFTDKSIVAVGRYLDGNLDLNDDNLAISITSDAVKWSNGTETYINRYGEKAKSQQQYKVSYRITTKEITARFSRLDDVKVNGVSCDWSTYDDDLGLKITVNYMFVGLDNCKAENGNNYFIPGATYSFIPNETPDSAKYHRVWEYYDNRDESNVYETQITSDLNQKFSVKILDQTDDRIRGNAVEHTVAIDKAIDATETSTGLTEGKHCSVCKAVLVEQKIVPVIKKDAPIATKPIIKQEKIKTPKATFKASKKKLTIKYKTVKNAVGFQVRYKVKGKWIIKNFATKKSATKSLKLKKGKYKVQIRSYSAGKEAFSKWTKVKTVKIK